MVLGVLARAHRAKRRHLRPQVLVLRTQHGHLALHSLEASKHVAQAPTPIRVEGPFLERVQALPELLRDSLIECRKAPVVLGTSHFVLVMVPGLTARSFLQCVRNAPAPVVVAFTTPVAEREILGVALGELRRRSWTARASLAFG